jgi:hypothetical protein
VKPLPYPVLCTLAGLVLGWVPAWIHGPIAYKFNAAGLDGPTAVWAFYSARLAVGFLVGITRWPQPWYLRGPLCGLVAMVPVSLVALATPGCGFQ